MSEIDDYFANIAPAQQAEFERIRRIVHEVVPSAEEGRSYGMPAYKYNGKPFLSAMARKKHLSLYPFSGKVIDLLRSQLAPYELTSGSIHFTEENPVPASLLQAIIAARLHEIEDEEAQA